MDLTQPKDTRPNVKLSPERSMWLAVLGVIFLVIGLPALSIAVYGILIFQIWKRGGKVSASEFGLPDLFVGSVFVVWFVGLIAQHFTSDKPHTVTQADLIAGAYFNIGVIAAILFFLKMRGIKPVRQFGFGKINLLKTGAIALGLLLASFPLLAWISQLTAHVLGPEAKKQELVQFFLNASQHSERMAVIVTIVVGVVLAPVAEELMFRGYLYGILKRYLGLAAAAVLSAGMFAAVHMNLASLPALFVLAMCLVIAYEATGSLLVTMTMHALFNLSMFLQMLYFPHLSAQ